MDGRQGMGAQAPDGMAPEAVGQPAAGRVALEDISGDFLTPTDFAAWSDISRNSAYELLRQDPYRQAVRRFGRQIRISKKALARIIEEAS